MSDSTINWKQVAYTIGGCWLIFALMYLLGKSFLMFLNPVPIVVVAVFGALIYGYVGSTSGYEVESIFLYWTLAGLWLSWQFHKSKRKPGVIIGLTALVHIVLSFLLLFPMMLIGGR